MSKVKSGDRVKVHFTGRLPDGSTFDSSREREPLEFEAGGEEVIRGFSDAVIGMEKGETKTVTVAPAEGFGERHTELEHEVPRSALPDGINVGDQLQAKAGERVIPIWVKDLGEEKATVDANHPLAGVELQFEIELLSIEPAA
ncbi:MAG: peptidylprolyl isomerase [Candidatus Eisenbacteria bacterium]|nr:peptidylprolyl isomerase [Candidatus Eisenbacteria bacterium]